VLTNDTDLDSTDNHAVSALNGGIDNGTTLTKVGTYGTLVITKATGGYTYTLANGQANVQALADGQQVTDVFQYTNTDNHGLSSQSTLMVTVTGVNDAPTPVADIVAVNEDASAAAATRSAGVLGNDTDPDTGETSTLVVSSIRAGTSGTEATLTEGLASVNGTYGTLTIHSDGTYSYTPNNAAAEALSQGTLRSDVFTYTAKDVQGATATATLTFNITGQNDAPVAVADVAAATEDALPNTVNGNVLTNDTDVDVVGVGDTHTVSAVMGGTDNGTTITAVGTYGTLVITKASGGYTYTLTNGQPNVQALADGQQVTDVFSYTNADNHNGFSSPTTLTVTVTGTNDAPVAMADVAAVTEDTEPNPVGGYLLANDTDVDTNDTHSVSALSGGTDNGTTLTKVGTYGTLVITKATGAYTYTLANDQPNVQALADGEQVTDVFTYTNSDNHGGSSSATLTVTVTGTGEESLQETDWIAENNGAWDTESYWSNGVPSSTVAAFIAITSTVSITSITAQAYSLTLSAGSTISLNDGTLQAGSITLGSDTTLEGHGAVSGPIDNSGLIKAFSAHTLDITGNVTGMGSIEVNNNTTLEIDGSVAGTQTLSFTGGASGTLVLDHSLTQAFNAVISGLTDDDYIDLKDVNFTSSEDFQAETSYSCASGHTTLEITKISTSQSVTFTLAGNYTTSTWIFDNDGAGGTIFHDPPAATADATTVSNSTSADLASTVTAALTTQDGSADQFAFQSDSQSSTLADPTLVASTDPSAADVSDSTQSSSDGTSAITTLAEASAATSTQPATADATQSGATSQPAAASPSATGSSADTFVFAANFGNVTLANFDPGADVIEIDHTVFADFQELLAAAHDDGSGNAVIAADSHDTITLKNVTVAQLVQHQGDFHFT
jgi:VCBS repeat-containing protein